MNGLIITADDFGIAEEVNAAVEIACRDGVLTAASLMVAGPAAAGAVAIVRRLPDLRVGLHLVLVEGRPVLPPEQIPDLVDGEGRLRRDMLRFAFDIALRPRVRRQLRAEIEAQFRAFRATGLALDHVSAHKHFHVHAAIAREVIAVGRRHGMRALRIPHEPALAPGLAGTRGSAAERIMRPWARRLGRQARREKLTTADAVFGLRWSGDMDARRLAALIRDLPPGLVEIYTHPAISDTFPGHAEGYRYRQELEALTHPDVAHALRRSSRRTGGYAEFSAPA